MRHPLLRILVALLIGVITPLCCCQAAAIAGGACDRSPAATQALDSCCGGCPADPASNRTPDKSEDEPGNDQQPNPSNCKSCPSCQGTSGGTGNIAEARLPVLKLEWNTLATLAIAISWATDAPEPKPARRPPGWADSAPYLKANRDAQRWHCALLV